MLGSWASTGRQSSVLSAARLGGLGRGTVQPAEAGSEARPARPRHLASDVRVTTQSWQAEMWLGRQRKAGPGAAQPEGGDDTSPAALARGSREA